LEHKQPDHQWGNKQQLEFVVYFVWPLKNFGLRVKQIGCDEEYLLFKKSIQESGTWFFSSSYFL